MGRYLVTGAAGFIGSQLAANLLQEGHDVVTIDNLSTGYRQLIPDGVIFLEGDCQDQAIIKELETYRFNAIYHIAGQSSGEISFDNPVYDLQTNTQSTLQLLKFCLDNGCPKFIYASSMSVYGDTELLPVYEEVHPKPKSFYAVGKLASEHYLRIYAQFGIATAALRLFNVYGPGQNLENMRQGMVSIFLAQALKKRHVHVKGSPERFRDFVYIDDVVRAFRQVEQKIGEGQYWELNVCSSEKTTVRELMEHISNGVGTSITKQFEGNTPGDQFGIYGDNHKIREEIGWLPVTDLRNGIQQMINWAKSALGI